MKTALTAVDEYGTPIQLAKISEFIPTRRNDEAVDLTVDMAWALKQVCPDHPDARTARGRAWTACRAHWTHHPLAPFKRLVAVMFLCPRGHPWDAVLFDPIDGHHKIPGGGHA